MNLPNAIFSIQWLCDNGHDHDLDPFAHIHTAYLLLLNDQLIIIMPKATSIAIHVLGVNHLTTTELTFLSQWGNVFNYYSTSRYNHEKHKLIHIHSATDRK